VVAIYTLNTKEEQAQEIGYSLDGGFTFIRYAGNPVINVNSTEFRDPKVIWYQDHWAMVVSYAQDFVIGIYASPNLKTWTHASNFSHDGLLGQQYGMSKPCFNANGRFKLLNVAHGNKH
jgi:beta-fructofuranosidase